MRVNRLANEWERREHPEAILLKVGRVATKDNNPQSMWIWPGQELIGAGGRAKKGLFYQVVSCTNERVVLEGNGETLGLSVENAEKSLPDLRLVPGAFAGRGETPGNRLATFQLEALVCRGQPLHLQSTAGGSLNQVEWQTRCLPFNLVLHEVA